MDSAAISFRSLSTCHEMVLLFEPCELRIRLHNKLIKIVGKRILLFEPEIELGFGWLPHYHCWRTERGTNCSDGLEWVSAGAIAKLSIFA